MCRASGGLITPHWIRNNILDFLRAMSVKIAVENEGIRIYTGLLGSMYALCLVVTEICLNKKLGFDIMVTSN